MNFTLFEISNVGHSKYLTAAISRTVVDWDVAHLLWNCSVGDNRWIETRVLHSPCRQSDYISEWYKRCRARPGVQRDNKISNYEAGRRMVVPLVETGSRGRKQEETEQAPGHLIADTFSSQQPALMFRIREIELIPETVQKQSGKCQRKVICDVTFGIWYMLEQASIPVLVTIKH